MKDELIIKCAKCGEVLSCKVKGIYHCENCSGSRCKECGHELEYRDSLYVCTNCYTPYTYCCLSKIITVERSGRPVVLECGDCGDRQDTISVQRAIARTRGDFDASMWV